MSISVVADSGFALTLGLGAASSVVVLEVPGHSAGRKLRVQAQAMVADMMRDFEWQTERL